MALRNKTMTAAEAQAMRDKHRLVWEGMEGKKDYSGIYGAVVTIGSAVNRFRKFIGPVGTVSGIADILWGVSHRANTARNINSFKGAEKQFERVRNILATGGHLRAEVQMNWIKFPSVSTQCEFAEGNNANPNLGYKILRVQLSNGSWVSYTN